MVRIAINKRRHLITLFLTAAIFIIGLLLGIVLTNSRVKYLSEINQKENLDYDSLQLQYLYISTLLEEENCPALNKALEENLNNLEIARIKLEGFIKEKKEKQYEILKRNYILSELNYWLFNKKVNKICGQDSNTVLFFYSNNCDICETQGTILTVIKEKFKDQVLIFSLDASFEEEQMIKILKESYNITSTPTMLINEKIKLEGIHEIEEIERIFNKTSLGVG